MPNPGKHQHRVGSIGRGGSSLRNHVLKLSDALRAVVERAQNENLCGTDVDLVTAEQNFPKRTLGAEQAKAAQFGDAMMRGPQPSPPSGAL
jgi:hypothetical protein